MATALEQLLADGVVEEVVSRLKSGKEADVYLVRHHGEIVAAKVYKERHARSFKNNAGYKEGRLVRNSRTQRAIDSGSRFGQEAEEEAWKSAEADTLFKLHGQGLAVPTPRMFYEGVLLMELVCDEHGEPAPRLIECELTAEQAAFVYAELRKAAVGMLCLDLIHGDLSPYNVLVAPQGPVVIDFPQIIGAAHNNQAETYFTRDLETLRKHLAQFDPSLVTRDGDAQEIWRAYTRRELSTDFVPSGRRLEGGGGQRGGRRGRGRGRGAGGGAPGQPQQGQGGRGGQAGGGERRGPGGGPPSGDGGPRRDKGRAGRPPPNQAQGGGQRDGGRPQLQDRGPRQDDRSGGGRGEGNRGPRQDDRPGGGRGDGDRGPRRDDRPGGGRGDRGRGPRGQQGGGERRGEGGRPPTGDGGPRQEPPSGSGRGGPGQPPSGRGGPRRDPPSGGPSSPGDRNGERRPQQASGGGRGPQVERRPVPGGSTPGGQGPRRDHRDGAVGSPTGAGRHRGGGNS